MSNISKSTIDEVRELREAQERRGLESTMTNNLKEEIEYFVTEQRLFGAMGSANKENYQEAVKKLSALINQREKELLEKFEEIVGENVKDDGAVVVRNPNGTVHSSSAGSFTDYVQNNLRTELRDRIKQLKEELNKEVV